MAFYQRAGKLALIPAGGAAAAASTSILLGCCGRYTSSTTNLKLNQVASRKLNTIAMIPSRAEAVQRRFAASMAKEVEAASSSAASTATKTAKVNEGGGGSKGFVQWYEGHLNSRPVITKAVTGSILWGIGDVVAQVAPTFFDDSHTTSTTNDGENEAAVTTTKKEFRYDLPRTARAVIFGFAIHAPLSHVHFNFLEWMTVKGGFSGYSIPVFKTIMEQFVYWSWISNSLYHGAMGAMQGMNLNQTYDRISDVLWDTQVAQWSFWIPVQLLNFKFVPVRHQLNVVLLVSVAWTALLSAWYPPGENNADDDEKEK